MVKILFVCHGNICRSPMAEYVMKDLVKRAGLEEGIQTASAATSREEIGNPVYPPARRKLAEHGISCDGYAARQLRNRDYEEYDLLIGMDRANLRNMYRICGGDFNDKMHLLMEYAGCRKGPPREPSEAGRMGREEARGVFGVFAAGGNGEKRTLLRRGGRSLVHRRLRRHLAGCAGGVSGAAGCAGEGENGRMCEI